jgi:hypothetical protein
LRCVYEAVGGAAVAVQLWQMDDEAEAVLAFGDKANRGRAEVAAKDVMCLLDGERAGHVAAAILEDK